MCMSFFDNIQDAAFKVITNHFGDHAMWTPAEGGETQNAQVLYKDAFAKDTFSDVAFNTERYTIEYNEDDFIGLKESVESRELQERIFVHSKSGYIEFVVRHCESKFDGQTIIAYLTPVTI